jgi:hypothetical protein
MATSIPTVASLRAAARRLDRRNRRLDRDHQLVEEVLDALCTGQSLHLSFAGRASVWRLSGGAAVDSKTAKAVIANQHVVAVGDALFSDCLSQTYRHTSPDHE